MKQCSKCQQTKDLEEFAWKSRDRLLKASWCRACKSEWSKKKWASGEIKQSNYEAKARRVERAREYIWNLFKVSKCFDCGERNPIVLEFDHLGDKFLAVSNMVSRNYGLDSIRAEIAKCDIVCANCHKIRTSERGKHWRYLRQD